MFSSIFPRLPEPAGGTQVDDFNKGKIGRIFTKFLRRRNGGCQGDPGPLIINKRSFFVVVE